MGNAIFVRTIQLFGVKCAYVLLSFVVIYFIPFAPKATKAIWHTTASALAMESSVR